MAFKEGKAQKTQKVVSVLARAGPGARGGPPDFVLILHYKCSFPHFVLILPYTFVHAFFLPGRLLLVYSVIDVCEFCEFWPLCSFCS